jgi:hypothetical protein
MQRDREMLIERVTLMISDPGVTWSERCETARKIIDLVGQACIARGMYDKHDDPMLFYATSHADIRDLTRDEGAAVVKVDSDERYAIGSVIPDVGRVVSVNRVDRQGYPGNWYDTYEYTCVPA